MFSRLKAKSKTNSILKKGLSAVVIAAVVLAFGPQLIAWSQSADQLEQEKAAKQRELQEVQKRIADYQSQIKQTQAQANTLNNQIKVIDLEIAEAEAQIEATETKIDAANLEIADVTNKIVKAEEDIAKQKQILKGLIADIYELDQRSPLEVALENDNFQQFLDQLEYHTSIQEQSQQTLGRIKQLQADLEVRRAALKTEKENLDNLLKSLDLQASNLEGQRVAKAQILAETRGVERNYQQLLSVTKAEQEALNKEIYDLDAAISAKLGNKKLPSIKGFLGWPMEGTMTQGYGNTGFTSLGYSFHNGLDIAARAGTRIYAAADGTVIATGTGEAAYGNWVTIKHDVGKFSGRAIVTLYAHMSSFVVKTGQTVKQGDLVGFEGNTGNTTRLLYGPHRGFHLHFTVFDADGFGVAPGTLTKTYGPYQVPYGAPYNPLDFL